MSTFRMLVKGKTDKIAANIIIRNNKDNAYNTKVTLSFTPNIHYMKVEVRFLEHPLSMRPVTLFKLFIFMIMCIFLYYQPDKGCNINYTKVECAVGYPFLGRNVEVSFSTC